MRFRLMATYLGVPYQAGLGPDGTEATLFSPGPPPTELGFAATAGHWRKQVRVTDLDALWLSRPVGGYRQEPCLVLDDLGDRLHIAYLGRDAARAAQLGYWEIDREVFEVVVARQEVTGLIEERVDFPLAAAMFSAFGAGLHARPTGNAAAAGHSRPTECGGAATGYDGEATSYGTGATPYGTGATPYGTGATPYGTGATPYGTGATPYGTGATPYGTGATPYGTGATPYGTGATPYGTGAKGYGCADYASRVSDRVAAWHGSPAPEPWPEPSPVSGARPNPRPRLWPARDPWSEPWTERPAGPEPWTERLAGPEPWTERPSGPEHRTERPPQPKPRTERPSGAEPWTEGPSGPERGTERPPQPKPRTEREVGSEPKPATTPGRRTGHKGRMSPESVFADLLTLSAIPQASYAVDEEVPGAMCLVAADGGFEVFSRTDDARLEVRFFEDEEAAYFYLFGVLVAEAVRSGRLGPAGPGGANGHNNGSGVPGTSSVPTGNVSKYLQGKNFPNSPSPPARVYLAGGADGPPLPKQPRRPPRSSSSQKHHAYHESVILSLPDNRYFISLPDSTLEPSDTGMSALGGAVSGGTRAVWLANWLSASATCYATQRTTALAASLLHCAASGQAAAEVSAVLLGMAGQEPLEPAAAKLLAAVQGADLARGLVAGCHSVPLLSVS